MEETENKSESPSARKVAEIRQQGWVPKSSDLSAAATLLGSAILLYFTSNYMNEGFSAFISEAYQNLDNDFTQKGAVEKHLQYGLKNMLYILAPFFIVGMIIPILSGFFQGGIVIKSKVFGLNKKKLISAPLLLFALLKTLLIFYVLFSFLYWVGIQSRGFGESSFKTMLDILFKISFALLFIFTAINVLFGLLDYAYQYWSFQKKIRMSKQELKEEKKLAEANPMVKEELKERAKKYAANSLTTQVASADFVITFSNQSAIALVYDRKKTKTPLCACKGIGERAVLICDIASQKGIPLIEDRKLSSLLWDCSQENRPLPVGIYHHLRHIAEIK